jgi:stage IV sporulation protein B
MMTFREKWRKILLIVLCISVLFTAGYGYFCLKNLLPERITVVVDENGYVNLHIPFTGTLSSDDTAVALYDESQAITSNNTVTVGAGKTAILNASETGSYELVYRLFGLIDIQKIQVDAVESQTLTPCGTTMGLYLETDGVMVVGTSELTDIDGEACAPAEDLLETGDYILAVNGSDISSKEDLISFVTASEGNALELTVRRNDETVEVNITPAEVAEADYKLGVWVRDDCQGIGTLTYIDSDGNFGALGHGISDVDTGMRVDSHEGTLLDAQVHSILKGTSGSPGSICGTIDYEPDAVDGTILANTEQGIFGTLDTAGIEKLQEAYDESAITLSALPIGYQQEVTTGTAYIRSAVSGVLTDYEIQITGVDTSKGNKNKGIVLEVTDERLLSLTGGIIQGMSGSPILQNGKIIGAVTHVFVQDSTKGYGIFIEKMLDTATAVEGN